MNKTLKHFRSGALSYLCPAILVCVTTLTAGCEPPSENVELQEVLTNLMSGRVVALNGNSQDLDTWADGYETYVHDLFPEVASDSEQVLSAVNGSLMVDSTSSEPDPSIPQDLTLLGLYAVGSQGTQEIGGVRADGTFEVEVPENESYRFGLIHLETGEELGELQLGGTPGTELPAYTGDHDFGEVLAMPGTLIPAHPPIGPIQTEALEKKKKSGCENGDHDGPKAEVSELPEDNDPSDLQE
jgi:hypothetical protein